MNLEVDLLARYVERLLATKDGMSFASIPELLDEIRAGRMVVVVDDGPRERRRPDHGRRSWCARPTSIS